MASKSIGSVYAELALRDKNFSSNLHKAGAGMKRFQRSSMSMGNVARGVGASMAVAGLAIAGLSGYLAKGTKDALDLGGRLSDVAAQTGLSVSSAMHLERAFKDGGLEATAMASSINKIQKVIAGANDGGEDPFAAMGLSADALLRLDPAKQFEEIGRAIARIENPTLRNAAAMKVFGKSGGKLMTVLGKGLGDARESLGSMPALMEKFANSFDRASDIMGNLPAKSEQFFTGFASGVIGVVLPNLEKINKFDFTRVGANFGAVIAAAFTGITNGTYMRVFENKMFLAIDNSAGKILDVFGAAFEALGEYFTNMIDRATEGVGDYFLDVKIANGLGTDQDKAMQAARLEPLKDVSLSDAFDKSLGKRIDQRNQRNKDLQTDTDLTLLNNAEEVAKAIRDALAATAGGSAAGDDEETQAKTISAEKLDLGESDYTRRGLALEGATTAIENKTVTVMTEVRNILARIEKADSNATF